MRYEDASGAFQASGPIANDDADTLAAGERGPATGNLITGEGTQYGAAGADSAAGAHVAAIAGQGGEDSSFAGGKLSVAGQYGSLSVDADGNYSYLANKGAPENVRDRFTYTLADNQGNTDTGALIVEIGKTPAVIKADAQQVIVGPDGVVTLPAGVELSDIMVVGRNLVVNMPDGTQMIIVDGAVFVPQLSLGGVDVPATNVAALLIGQEVQPAAGEATPSSGGNFALPPPPLDPGVPLGDLLPPTEYDYTPPEPQEVLDTLDEEPEIFVQPDGQPAQVNAVDQVDEAGLPTRNEGEPEGSGEGADGNPSNDSDPSEATGGVIIYNSPDGVASITINGVVITSVGQVIVGEFGTLEITSIADGQIGYEYTLLDNTSGDATHDDFAVVLTDEDGDTASATLTINIIDDTPTAVNDTDSIPAGEYGPATGNVLTDADPGDAGDSDDGADTVGADDAELTNVTGFGATEAGEGGWVVQGQYGVLTINTDGSYSYVRDEGTPGGVSDVFTYTLTDGDGDVDTATLTIDIGDATPETRPNPIAKTDDDAVPGADGNPGGTGDDVDAQNLSGNLTGVGGDGPLTFDLLTTGAPAGFTYVDGPDGSVLVQQVQNGSTVTVLTITIDASTGAYTITQNAPILHPTLNGQAGDDTENNVSFTINYNVTDQDGDSAPGTLQIDVDDDTPTAKVEVDVGGVVDEDGLPGGNVGGVNDVPGAATVVQGNVSDLFNPGADQPLTYSLSSDTSGLPQDLTSNGNPVTYSVVGNTLTASADGSPVFTLVLNPTTGEYTFTLLDQLDHPSLDGLPGDDTENPDDSDLSIALGSIIQATDADGDTVTADANGLNITVDDDSPEPFEDCPDDVITVNEVGSTFTGNLNLPPVGADEPGVVSFVVEDGDPVLDNEGNPVTSEGTELFYFVNEDGVLEARAGDAAGDVIFTITLNGDGTFTYEQVGVFGEGSEFSFNDLTSSAAGNVEFRGVGADDPATTVDLLLSAGPGDGVTVNTDSDSIGSANQSMDNGETVRIDLVSDLTTGGGTPSGFSYGAHVSSSSFIGLIPQVQGSQDQTVAFTVWAVNSGNTQASEPDRDPAGGFSDGSITAVTEVTVKDYLTGEATTVDVTGFTVGVFTPVAYGISARVNADGSVTFSGIQEGDSYGFTTGSGEFNAIVVRSEPAGTGGSTQDSYDLGVFSIGVANEFDPFGLSVPIALTDSDGDAVVCDIDVNVGVPLDAPEISVTVNEAGLPLIGSDSASNSEIASGDLQSQVTGGTGPYTFVLVGSGNGTYGTLVLNDDGTYTYTLDTPFDSQPDADDGTNPELGAETFTFEATDSLGATQTGTITVNIIDDVPTAVADTDSIAAGQYGPVGGNVITDASAGDAGDGDAGADTKGADGATVVGVAAGDTGADLDNPATVGVVIQGAYGKLTLNSDGSYTYVRDPGTDGGVEDVFTYTIEDGDGDRSNTTLTITIADSPPTIDAPDQGEAGTVVDEKGLPTRGESPGSGEIADGNGTNNSDTSETTAGVINFTAPDGPAIIRIDGVVVTGVPGQTFAGTHGTLTITGYNAATGQVSYSYTLNDNTSGDATFDDFAIQVEDQDGDLANDTLVVNIIDDEPTANDDVDSVVGGFDPATGNVLTGVEGGNVGEDTNGTDGVADVPGADGGRVTNIDHDASPAEIVPNGGSVQIQGDYGVLTIYSNGDYSYLRDPGTPGGVSDVFTYTLTDGDGDTDTATLTIGIDDNFPLAGNVDVQLDDDALAGGNAGGTDDDPNGVGTGGNLPGSGGDGAHTFSVLLTGEPAGFDYVSGGAGVVLIQQGGETKLTVTVNPDGSYTVVQNNPIDHPTPGVSEENLDFVVNYRVTDADGDFDDGTISINVDDDTPTVSASTTQPTLVVDETDLAANAGPTSFAGVFTASFGADGQAAVNPSVYTLGINAGVTGIVDTATGEAVVLVMNGGVVEGRTSGTNDLVFTVTVDGSGNVTLDQLRAVVHNDPADHDEPGASAVTLANDNMITLTRTITDGDGDTASATADIGRNLQFEDDGPDATVNGTAPLDTIVLDESRPEGTDTAGGSAPNGDASATANFADNFAVVTDFGSDGPADAQAVVYSLFLSANGINSGLFALDNSDTSTGDGDGYGQGDPITLSMSGGVITGSANGTDYFTISIDPATGVVTFTQINPIWHPTAPGNFDETATLTTAAASNVQVVQTVTDGDGDTDSVGINVGAGVFSIQDDGPQAIQPDAASLENEVGATVTEDLDDDGEVITDFGEDGEGLVQFANITPGGHASGLTSNDDPIEYWLSNDGQTLQARTNSTNGSDGELIFTVQINQATGDYTVTMTGTIDNGGGFVISDFSAAPAGQNEWIGLDPDGNDINADNNDSSDLLLTSTNAGGTVNTDSDDIANGNQWITSGEGIRIDYVTDVRRDGANDEKDAQGYTFDAHFVANGSSFSIIQTQGSGSGASVRISALNDSDGGNIKTLGGSIVPIDISSIVVTGDASYTIVDMGDGTFVITGLAAGANVSFDTNGADYNAISITSAAGLDNPNIAGTNLFGGQDFAIGEFGYFTENAGDPIDVSFDLSITDADGDTVTVPGAIDITFEPATDTLQAPLVIKQAEIEKVAANSNTLTLAAAVAASGMTESAAAAARPGHELADRSDGELVASHSLRMADRVADDGAEGSSSSALAARPMETVQDDHVSPGAKSTATVQASHGLDDSQSAAPADASHQAANDQGPATADPQVALPPSVAMVSAEALQAAGLDGAGNEESSVAQVVAEALGQADAPTVDGLLAHLPGGIQALAHVASQDAGSVPGWDMAAHGGFATGHDMLIKVDVISNHHDAIQPAVNG